MVYEGGEHINDLERNLYLRDLDEADRKGEQLNDLRRQWLLQQLNNPGGATPVGNYHGVIQARNADGSALDFDDAVRIDRVGLGTHGIAIFDPDDLDNFRPILNVGWYNNPAQGHAYGGVGSIGELSLYGEKGVVINSFGPVRTNSNFRLQGDAHRELRLGKYKNPTIYMGGNPWVFGSNPAHYEQEEFFNTDHTITFGNPPVPVGSFTVNRDLPALTWEIHSRVLVETTGEDAFLSILGSVNGGPPFPISFIGVNAGIEEVLTDAWADGMTGTPQDLSEGDTVQILMQVDNAFAPIQSCVVEVKGSTEPWIMNLVEQGSKGYGNTYGVVQMHDGVGGQTGFDQIKIVKSDDFLGLPFAVQGFYLPDDDATAPFTQGLFWDLVPGKQNIHYGGFLSPSDSRLSTDAEMVVDWRYSMRWRWGGEEAAQPAQNKEIILGRYDTPGQTLAGFETLPVKRASHMEVENVTQTDAVLDGTDTWIEIASIDIPDFEQILPGSHVIDVAFEAVATSPFVPGAELHRLVEVRFSLGGGVYSEIIGRGRLFDDAKRFAFVHQIETQIAHEQGPIAIEVRSIQCEATVNGSSVDNKATLSQPGSRAYVTNFNVFPPGFPSSEIDHDGIIQHMDDNGNQSGSYFARVGQLNGGSDVPGGGDYIGVWYNTQPSFAPTIAFGVTNASNQKDGFFSSAIVSATQDCAWRANAGLSLFSEESINIGSRAYPASPDPINEPPRIAYLGRGTDEYDAREIIQGEAIELRREQFQDSGLADFTFAASNTWYDILTYNVVDAWPADTSIEINLFLEASPNFFFGTIFFAQIVTPQGTYPLKSKQVPYWTGTNPQAEKRTYITSTLIRDALNPGDLVQVQMQVLSQQQGAKVLHTESPGWAVIWEYGDKAYGTQEGAVQYRNANGVQGGDDNTRLLQVADATGLGFYDNIDPDWRGAVGAVQDPQTQEGFTGLIARNAMLLHTENGLVHDVGSQWLLAHEDIPVEAPGDEHYYLMGVGPTATPEGRRAITFFKVINAHTDWAEDTTDITFDKETWTSIVAVTATAQYDPGDKFECQALCYAAEGEDIFEFRVQGSTVGDIPLGSIPLSDGAQGTFTQSATIGGTIPSGEVLTLQVYTNENDGQQILGATQPSRIVLTKPGGVEGVT